MKKLSIVFFVATVLVGCGQGTEIMSSKFSSMDNCLSSIKRNTNSTLDIITNKLGNISGKLSNGEHFACQTKTSGTEGIYVEGWYTIKKQKLSN